MSYTVDPGLYALGNPKKDDPVLVTANYKMSFDSLRQSLKGKTAWILVLDTKGINVWCAAGKKSFGTDELVGRIKRSRLGDVVNHRLLILPQLAGPGVAAHRVKKLSGFKVIYGPIRAEDLTAFLSGGMKTTPKMRLKRFDTWERMVLIPVELVDALKWVLIISPVFLFLGGFGGMGGYWEGVFDYGLFSVLALLGALVAGAVLTPLFLPWLPGRAFSLKGLFMGLIVAVVLGIFRLRGVDSWVGTMEVVPFFFLVPGIAAYLAMNFTGASTFTSLSGVRKEMKWAVPAEITLGAIGAGLWVGSLVMT